ncbi:CBS domain-containing protein [Nocardia sp. GTS18]|uniref:CBS domain-containing protein n=1 Tax=Nocardia sp. GTS18 TaxID=1778064 RepID=UPI0015EF2EF3|nr:CBS domain-containing protein [Nocardia sp. GTS18]
MRAWTVRGGWDGHREEAALEIGAAIAGWAEVRHDFSEQSTFDDLCALLDECYPAETPRTRKNWAHQIWRFLHEISVGDYVVMPRKYRDVVAIGQVTGDYEYQADQPPGYRHIRPVKWLKTVERAAISGDLRDSMGTLLTVSELSRRDAAERVKMLAENGTDPGYSGAIAAPDDIDGLIADVDAAGSRQLSVRDLLGLWGFGRRTSEALEEVGSTLQRHGLTVRPDFTTVQLDSIVTVVATDPEETETVSSVTGAEMTEAGTQDLTWRVGNVRQQMSVVAVKRADSLHRAIELMVTKRLSQLPIVDDHYRLLGVVTWESIAHRSITGAGVELWDARAAQFPPAAHSEQELFSRMDDIRKFGFIIVVDSENVVTGIVTAADLADELEARVTPFMVLEELERRLRQAIHGMSPDLLKTVGKKKAEKPEDLTLGNYSYLFENPAVWKWLGWPFEQAGIVERLRAVARYRNEIAHWNIDAPENEPQKLADARELLDLLKLVTPAHGKR